MDRRGGVKRADFQHHIKVSEALMTVDVFAFPSSFPLKLNSFILVYFSQTASCRGDGNSTRLERDDDIEMVHMQSLRLQCLERLSLFRSFKKPFSFETKYLKIFRLMLFS